MKYCTNKKCKWIIIVATIGLLLGCFVISKLMAHPYGRGYYGRGYWGGGVGFGVGVGPYYNQPVVGVGPVVTTPGISVGIGGPGYYGRGYYRRGYGRRGWW
jgi:hypothetical protein